MLGVPLSNAPLPVPGVRACSLLEHRSGQRGRVPPLARAGPDGRNRERGRDRDGASSCRAPARPRSPRSTGSPACWPAARGYDHIVFDTAPTGHTPASAEPAQSLERLPEGQRPWRLPPGPGAFGTEDAGSPFQCGAGRPERPAADHRDAGRAPEQGAIAEAAGPRSSWSSFGLGKQALIVNGLFRPATRRTRWPAPSGGPGAARLWGRC